MKVVYLNEPLMLFGILEPYRFVHWIFAKADGAYLLSNKISNFIQRQFQKIHIKFCGFHALKSFLKIRLKPQSFQ